MTDPNYSAGHRDGLEAAMEIAEDARPGHGDTPEAIVREQVAVEIYMAIDAIRALSPSAPAITEEVIEAACLAFEKSSGHGIKNYRHRDMLAAIDAALRAIEQRRGGER